MGHVRIYDKWQGYSLDDCSCEYCLYRTKKGDCSLDECCCVAEKLGALQRDVQSEDRVNAASIKLAA